MPLLCRYNPAVIRHCLHVYGRSPAQADSAEASPEAGASSSGSSSCVLDERQVCLHYARRLLQQRAVWPLHAFLPAWEQEVPGGCWVPQEEMLAGEALVLQPDPIEGRCAHAVQGFMMYVCWPVHCTSSSSGVHREVVSS